MKAYLNYLVEANLGLCLFLLLYFLLLSKETDFAIKRKFLLVAIALALIFPLFHIQVYGNVTPVLSDFVPASWLPEFVVVGHGEA
ncbi:MAG TPA: hypothetical protein VD816_03540, partial [Ohtaekwangia sp.]|nr:hypothetical protein [Ohtaekwangia sp.]